MRYSVATGTPTGFLNLRGSQNEITGRFVDYLNSITDYNLDQSELFDNVFRLWGTRDYASLGSTRSVYLRYLASLCGLSWFRGTNAQLAALIEVTRRGWSENDVINIRYLIELFIQPPFMWITQGSALPSIVFGYLIPALFAENLIIFSESETLPATPADTEYTARAWTAPDEWTLQPSSSTYYSRGYLVGGYIRWTTPISTSVYSGFIQVATVAELPGVATTGMIGHVEDDSTGDVGALYFYDGSVWRKNSTPNASQGTVGEEGTRAVYAPNPDENNVNSTVTPPISGPSKGYGQYGSLSQQVLTSTELLIEFTLTPEGVANMNAIIYFFRAIKPSRGPMNMKISFTDEETEVTTTIPIYDTGEIF